jgi:hypothetical protein
MSGIERVGNVIKMTAPTKWRAGSSVLRSCRDVPNRGIRKFEITRMFFFGVLKKRLRIRPLESSLFVSAEL